MSVEFDEVNDTEALNEVGSIAIQPYPLTILCSLKVTSNTATTQRNILLGGPSSMLLSIYVNGTPDIACQARNEIGTLRSTSDVVSNLTLNQWYTVALVCEDATSFSTYVDGTQIQDNVEWGGGFDWHYEDPEIFEIFPPSDLSQLWIGAWGSSQRSDSRMANVAIWEAALSQDQCEALTSGVSPLQYPDNLKFHWEARNSLLNTTVGELATLQQYDVAETTDVVLDDNPPLLYPE